MFHDIFWPLRSAYPICLFVDGAWVMTELDWGEGRACWITMLVSWLPIREWDCWCWPWPAWPCSEMFCKEKRGGEWAQYRGLGLYKEHFQVQNNTSISTIWPWTSHIQWVGMGNEELNKVSSTSFSVLSWEFIDDHISFIFILPTVFNCHIMNIHTKIAASDRIPTHVSLTHLQCHKVFCIAVQLLNLYHYDSILQDMEIRLFHTVFLVFS